MLGALGGKRVEHTLANLCTGLGLEQRGIRAALQDERSRITFVLPGESRSYPKEKFFYFSAFPMEGRAEGVCEKGSFYELEDAMLTAGYPLGVSNEYRRRLRLHHRQHPAGCTCGGGDHRRLNPSRNIFACQTL